MSYSFSDQPQAYKQQPVSSENTLGLLGFIFSLVGVFFCFAAPVGLLLSLMGLRKEPRGLAVAGSIIGGFLSLIYGVIVAIYGAIILTMVAACIGVTAFAVPQAQTISTMRQAAEQIENSKDADGAYPDEAAGNQLIAGSKDYWQQDLRYEPTGDGFVIRSAGPDKQFDTSDDIHMNETQLKELKFDPAPPPPTVTEEMPAEEMPVDGTPPEEATPEQPPAELPPAELPPAELPNGTTEATDPFAK